MTNMEVKFRAIKKVSLSQIVADKVLRFIKEGHLSVGDKLPPERELCQTFGVSRTSLREGICSLTHMGILETVRGSGVFVRRGSPGAVFQKKLEALHLSKKNILDLIEFREGLELFIGELACRNATTEDMAKLEQLIDRMEQSPEIKMSISAEDVEFHKELAAASHNEYVILVYESILPFVQNWVQAREEVIEPKVVATLHREIVKGIRWGSIKKVKAALDEHFDHMRWILQSISEEE